MILSTDRNIWRRARARRAALLIDAANYFGALREALLNARSSVFVIGWDLDSRTRLVGESGTSADGYPDQFIDLLTALVKEHPRLKVHVLIWDYSVLYALEREPFPSLSLAWRMPQRIRYCLDDDLPPGASHHQKIVVVDDALAFVGGIDVTVRRWDTRAHRLEDPQRIDPAGAPYGPFHDVQAMVDGDAAAALAELARVRWVRGACEPPTQPCSGSDPWPISIVPDFVDIDVGIARTSPDYEEHHEVREVEALFADSIDCAVRSLYVENQFLTASRIADHLAKRMRERPELEAVLVVPKSHRSWLESQIMREGRIRFMQTLQAAGVADRVALLYPNVSEDGRELDVMVHSKVMVVDDVLLRVGSANLNNRSSGFDTECDLAIEAQSTDQRRQVEDIRNRLLGHHCGATEEQVSDCLARTRSLIKTAIELSQHGHSLKRVCDDNEHASMLLGLEKVGDPERPIAPPALLKAFVGERPRARRIGRLFKLSVVALVVLSLVLAWRFTPLSALAHPDLVRQWFVDIAGMRAAPVIVVAVFVLGGLSGFPVLLLIAATSAHGSDSPWPVQERLRAR